MNPILNLLHGGHNQAPQNQNGSGINGILSMFNAFRNSNDPDATLNAMASQSPGVQQAMDLIKQYNGDGKAAFYAKAKEMGIDPNYVLNLLK